MCNYHNNYNNLNGCSLHSRFTSIYEKCTNISENFKANFTFFIQEEVTPHSLCGIIWNLFRNCQDVTFL